jgi:hypothetical protein
VIHWLADVQQQTLESGFTAEQAVKGGALLVAVILGCWAFLRVGNGRVAQGRRADAKEAEQLADIKRSGPPRFNG